MALCVWHDGGATRHHSIVFLPNLSRDVCIPCRACHLQLGSSAVPPGLREKVLDQLSMHFQLLVQTGVLAAKVRV